MDWGEARIMAGGRSLEAAGFGPPPGEAPTLVLLHEGLGCVALWRDFPERLVEATGWGVFAWSRAGYGRSDPADLPLPTDYMTREAVEVLPEVLDAIGLREGVLLGHSDGATIAAIHAGEVRDPRVRGLVLIAPHFFAEEAGLAEIARARKAFRTTDLRERMARYHHDPAATFRGWNDVWLSPGFRTWYVADCIERWQVPTLAIQGSDDAYGTLAQIDAITARAQPPVEILILDGCGHSPHRSHGDSVVAAVAAFLSRMPGSPSGREI